MQKMLIFVRQANGNGFEFQVNPNSPINQLYQCLKDKITENNQKSSLYFKGQLITQTDKSFANLNIQAMDIIHIKQITKKRDRQCLINVNIFHQNEIYSLRINNQETVSKLKHKLSQITHIHPKSQSLFSRGKKLSQNLTLTKEEIQNDSLISLIVMERKEPFQLYEGYFGYPERQHLDIISSLKIKRTESQNTKTSLFRSDSLGIKGNEGYNSPEIQVKCMKNNAGLGRSIDSEAQLNRLFNICMEVNSQGIKILSNSNEEVKLLKGNFMHEFLKPTKLLRFLKSYNIAQNEQDQQNQEIEGKQKDKQLKSKQKTLSIYKKLQFDQSSDSLQFQALDHICEKSVYSQQVDFVLKDISDNPELTQ